MAELTWVRYPLDILPGGITGGFGASYGGYKHRGTDVGVVRGTPVFAPQAGTAVTFTNDGSFGKAVCLMHPGTGWFSLYAHLDLVDVFIGQEVRGGQRIGLSGNTGFSTGPHLHWQVSTSPSFPTDIRFSRDAMAVPFQDQEEEMSPDERELLTLVASVVGGWSTGQTFQDPQEALPSFRTFEAQGQRVLIGLGLTQEALDKAVLAMTAHIQAAGHDDPVALEALAAVEEAQAVTREMRSHAINYPEPGPQEDPD